MLKLSTMVLSCVELFCMLTVIISIKICIYVYFVFYFFKKLDSPQSSTGTLSYYWRPAAADDYGWDNLNIVVAEGHQPTTGARKLAGRSSANFSSFIYKNIYKINIVKVG